MFGERRRCGPWQVSVVKRGSSSAARFVLASRDLYKRSLTVDVVAYVISLYQAILIKLMRTVRACTINARDEAVRPSCMRAIGEPKNRPGSTGGAGNCRRRLLFSLSLFESLLDSGTLVFYWKSLSILRCSHGCCFSAYPQHGKFRP